MSTTLQRPTALALIGLSFMWFGIVIGNYVGLFERTMYSETGRLISGTDSVLTPSTYVFLVALVSLALFTALAFRSADVQLAKGIPGALPVFRFTTVGVIVSLVSLAIFAISLFFASFNEFRGRSGIVEQLLGVYLPIILAAAACIFALLAVTVYRKSNASEQKADPDQKRAKREAALAFVYPIVGTTLALIIGLLVYQASRENPQVWVWVIILAIVSSSIVAGSIYAARTRAHNAVALVRPLRVAGTAALNLNFALVVIFVVVVTIMAFTFGIGAISELDHYYDYSTNQERSIDPITLDWFIKSMLPAMLILALVEVSTWIAVRIRSIVVSQ